MKKKEYRLINLAGQYKWNWIVIAILIILMLGLVYWWWNITREELPANTITHTYNRNTDRFSDTDIKTRLYTVLPESIEDYAGIKNNMGYYRLANGLEVILVHCPGETGDITVEAVINSGAISDPEGFDELNHFIEHLVFMKTKNFKSMTDMQALIPLAEYNGETTEIDVGLHWTLTALSNDTTRDILYLLRMLFILKEMIYNSEFNHDKFILERDIVNREYDIRVNDITSDHSEKISSELYKTTSYRKQYNTNPDNLNNITPEIATEYYKKWYQPDNMRVFIYGNLPFWPLKVDDYESLDSDIGKTAKPESVVEEVDKQQKINLWGWILNKYFVDNQDNIIGVDEIFDKLNWDFNTFAAQSGNQIGKLPTPDALGYTYTFDIQTILDWMTESQTRLRAKNPLPAIEYITNGPVEKVITDPRLTQTKFYMVFKHPYFLNKELVNATNIIPSILYDRLFRVLRDENGLVYTLDVSSNQYDSIFNEYYIDCLIKSQDIPKVKEILLAELAKISAGNYITEQEYNKYKITNTEYNDSKTDCSSITSGLSSGISLIRSSFRITNDKFQNNIYDKVSLDTLNQITTFIFDPKVCEIFIFMGSNPSITTSTEMSSTA
jgi:predicted Zn-dependent peptidase